MLQPQQLFQTRWFRVALQAIVTLAVMVFIVLGSIKLWNRLETTPNFASTALWLGIALAVIHRVVNAYGWTIILEAIGSKADGKAATRIWLLAESRRWLPGGVWGYASRASMAPRMGVTVASASASMLLELLVLLVAAFLVSLPGIWLYWDTVLESLTQLFENVPLLTLFAGAAACVPIGCWAWKKFGGKVKMLKQKYESLRDMQLHYMALLRGVVFFCAMACLNGLVTNCLLRALPSEEGNSVPMSILISATAIAWLVGFFAIFSPGGLIVREGALALLLMPWIPYSLGFTLAILARLVQVFAEIVCMLWVVITDLWHKETKVTSPSARIVPES